LDQVRWSTYSALAAVSAGVAGELSARASDLDVDALGVVLSTIGGAGGVESDDLVTEDEVTRGDVLGDGDGPGVVVGLSK